MKRLTSLIRRTLEKLRREHASPTQIGMAVAVGVLVGCSPFWGLHLLLAVGLATLFRLNRLAVILGTQISMPPLTPVLLFGNAQLGSWLLTGHGLTLTLHEIRTGSLTALAASLFWQLLLGGAVIGGALAAAIGFGTAALLRRREAR